MLGNLGTFATKDIPKGTQVMPYVGFFHAGVPPDSEYRSVSWCLCRYGRCSHACVCMCRAAEVEAAETQVGQKVYCAGVGPCTFFNDAMGPVKGHKTNPIKANNCKLMYDVETLW